jgi:uncharacterized membrane protein HdeD (DUF308 family)
MFLIIASFWTFEVAVAKLLTGWVAGIVLGFILVLEPEVSIAVNIDLEQERQKLPTGQLFRLLGASLILLAIWSSSSSARVLAPGVGLAQFYGGAILICMGLLHLSLTSQPLRIVLGLLTILAGAEIIYDSMENSILVTSLLSFVSLSLALVGAYLLLNYSNMESKL